MLGLSGFSFGQSLSKYKYVIIPNTFSFQKKPHQYDLNRLAQFLLNKYHFESFIEGDTDVELPKVDAANLLRLKVIEKGAFVSKISLVFLDYKGREIYVSKEGKSNRKDFKGAYTEALRNAFDDAIIADHIYEGASSDLKPSLKSNTPEKQVSKKLNTHSKTTVFQLKFNLRGKEYVFIPISKLVYQITNNNKIVGQAILQKDAVTYNLDAGTLTGVGRFDDYGNFILTRINPANNKSLTDTMSRVE